MHTIMRLITPGLVIIGILSGAVNATTTMRLNLRVAPSAWGSGQFETLLHDAIDRSFSDQELRWEALDGGWLIAPTESLREAEKLDKKVKNIPQQMRALLVSVEVLPLALITRKTFDAPGLFHNYAVFGEARARLRVIERSSGKIIADEEVLQSQRGPKVLQLGIDADKYDPDLQMTAMNKHRFFMTLEQSCADAVAARLAELLN